MVIGTDRLRFAYRAKILFWVGQRNEKRMAHAGADTARDMPLTRGVFGKEDRAWTEAAYLSVADLDFNLAGEIHDELAARRVMPVD